MHTTKTQKDILRNQIASLKKSYTAGELLERSQEIMSIVEIIGVFQEAKNIFLYSHMEGEVETMSFIDKWYDRKNFYLPVTLKKELVFRKYTGIDNMQKSKFGILEPLGDDFTDYNNIELIIVPGVAFDRNKNRMGYGRGYYDKFLPKLKAAKMGVCFEFQLQSLVPVDQYDIPMDYVVSENDLIW